MGEVGAATAAAGGDADAISTALNDGVSGVTGVRIPGYQEKVNAYLDDQAQTPSATLNMAAPPSQCQLIFLELLPRHLHLASPLPLENHSSIQPADLKFLVQAWSVRIHLQR